MEITPELRAQSKALRAQLDDWAYAYYVLDEPRVPDAEYDRVYRALEGLEQTYPGLIDAQSPTQRVGGQALDAFEPARIKRIVQRKHWLLMASRFKRIKCLTTDPLRWRLRINKAGIGLF
jgi:NAD-dependent DNA ligase